MSHYPPYPAYKDSGVEWLGTIPEHWIVGKVKWEFDAQLGKMLQPEKKHKSDIKVPYHKAVSVQWENIANEPPEIMWASPDEAEKYQLQKDDLLICEGGDVGRAGIFENNDALPVIIQNSVHRVRPLHGNLNKTLLRIMQICRSSGWFDVLCSKATIVHFTSEKLGDLAFPIAPPDEQKAIVAYIEYESNRIDFLNKKTKNSITLLKERRSALITAAVTGQIDLREAA